jgi:hypothetical protein
MTFSSFSLGTASKTIEFVELAVGGGEASFPMFAWALLA